ncbi:MAG: Lrp/AsnC family transcriptional regulator [Cyclobacteriaceae bacterium]|nr:Lrp/AsnC family transcriptional regulator [Cyclobacteriaceae bacterium]
MLDSVDKQIVETLQKDGRITIKALAEKLNLTTTPVFERVKRLEKEGVIDKYVALVNAKKVGRNLIVFISISLKNHTRSYLDKFVAEMRSYNEIMECYHIAGNFDYLLKAQLKDMEAFQQFILNKLSVNSNIAHVQSSFVLSKDKYSTALPV